MDLRTQARHLLGQSRGMADKLLKSFQTRDDWTYQVHAEANPALWIVAHIGLADNAFTKAFRPALAQKPDGWDELFWFGSRVQSDPSVFPDQQEVLGYFRERRKVLLEVLADLSDEELQAPAPPAEKATPIAGAPNMGYSFLFIGFHEGMHLGQLTVIRRALGHKPLMGGD